MARRSIDYTLLIISIVLVMFGTVMVFSASFYTAENSAGTGYNGYYYFWKQITGAGMGLAAMIIMMLFDYNKLKTLRFWILGAGIALMLLVFTPLGIEVNGSRRWVNLFILDLQSVEVLKFSLIVFIAASISINANKMKQFKYGMLPYLLLLMISAVLLFLQPNFSAIVSIALMIFVMMLVGGVNLFHFTLLGLGGIGAGGLAMVASEYRVDRIFAFLDPWAYQGDQAYQLVQSLYSIGSGGLFGLGLGNSRQKFLFLPYSESDTIFAIITEELGYVGALLVLIAFGVLIWRGVRIALRAPNMFGMMLATGITALIAIQVFINIGVVTGSVPPTGVSLPFISYGRTSLIVFMAMIGVLLNISKQSRLA